MPIPSYEGLMLPMLRLLRGGEQLRTREMIARLAAEFHLSADELRATYASGHPLLAGRASWARTFLKHAGLIEYPRPGFSQITERGLGVLRQSPPLVNYRYLLQFPEFAAFYRRAAPVGGEPAAPSSPAHAATQVSIHLATQVSFEETPEEKLETGYRVLRAQTERELLERVQSCSPEFFEHLVVRLLVALGYGGSLEDAEAVGRSHDGGIDGVVKLDRLGLDTVYVQAKRWQGAVGASVVREFVGALHGRNAQRGVLFTTSQFTSEAIEFAHKVNLSLILIDGESLAKLMFDANLGVSTVSRYEVKQPDSDFFEDEEPGASSAATP